MGSLSDYEVVKPALDLFEGWGVPYEVLVASAHRTPEKVTDWVTHAEGRGMQVIIAAAGGAAHLPGVLAAQTLLPIIGVPVDAGPLRGVDSLYSIVQMPPGIPVATVGINNSVNAATLALHILSRIESRWRKVLQTYREKMAEKVAKQNAELREERPRAVHSPPPLQAPRVKQQDAPSNALPATEDDDEEEEFDEVRPVDLTQPLKPAAGAKSISRSGQAIAATETTDAPRPRTPKLVRKPRYIGRKTVDPDLMAVEIAEQAVDVLLDGGIIAIPTDTVYGLAVDATNDEAIQRLYDLKGRGPDRPIAVFIDSQRLLASLVRNLTVDVRRMLEAFWPGPLTVVFERRGDDFAHLSPEPTLGVRLPDHSIPLALMQELCRPIACTSANPSGMPAATSGAQVEKYFGKNVDMILDAGEMSGGLPSTVVDVTQIPFRIKREGAISRAQIAAVVGDLLNPDEEEE